MTIEATSSLICAGAAVATLLIKLRDKHPRIFKNIIESIIESIPFGVIPYHMTIAIALFTIVRIYELYKEAHKPNLCTIDAYWSLAALCLHTGFFAAVAVWFKQ